MIRSEIDVRFACVATTFVLVSILTPASASAWGLEWLDHLSGPGPFVGFKIDARALCWVDPAQAQGPGRDTQSAVAAPWDGLCVRDGLRRDRADVDAMRGYVSLEAVWSSSSRNEMFGSLQFDPRTETDLFSFRPAVMFRAFRAFDAGLALGVNRFSGAALTSDFTWISIQPRVVITPFANSRSRVARAMEFRTDVVFIPQKARDEFIERVRRDLPVQPVSFEGGELRMMFGVEVDLFRLF
jgi:hypothetical protein